MASTPCKEEAVQLPVASEKFGGQQEMLGTFRLQHPDLSNSELGREGFEILVTSRNFCKPHASGIRADGGWSPEVLKPQSIILIMDLGRLFK